MDSLAQDEPTWRCQMNPFVGALGNQEPVILGHHHSCDTTLELRKDKNDDDLGVVDQRLTV